MNEDSLRDLKILGSVITATAVIMMLLVPVIILFNNYVSWVVHIMGADK